ncbi:MAG: hypothetical protein ABI833_07625 [Acidobacteriota bacterium]
MTTVSLRFMREEEGQDLVEYTLLLCFSCLAAAALFIGSGQGMGEVWNDTNIMVSAGGTYASKALAAAS